MAINLAFEILLIIMSYVVGSIPAVYIAGRVLLGVDIWKHGNMDGANFIHLLSKKVKIATDTFDMLKGLLMVLFTKYILIDIEEQSGFFANSNNIIAAVAFLTVLGHCFSIFLKFKGGKGEATVVGVIFALDPLTGLILVIFWSLIVGTTQFTSLGNLLSIILVPVVFGYRLESDAYSVLSGLFVVLIFFTHRVNISRLINGVEQKFGEKEAIKN